MHKYTPQEKNSDTMWGVDKLMLQVLRRKKDTAIKPPPAFVPAFCLNLLLFMVLVLD